MNPAPGVFAAEQRRRRMEERLREEKAIGDREKKRVTSLDEKLTAIDDRLKEVEGRG